MFFFFFWAFLSSLPFLGPSHFSTLPPPLSPWIVRPRDFIAFLSHSVFKWSHLLLWLQLFFLTVSATLGLLPEISRDVPLINHNSYLDRWSSAMTQKRGLRPKGPVSGRAKPSLYGLVYPQNLGWKSLGWKSTQHDSWFLDIKVILRKAGIAWATSTCPSLGPSWTIRPFSFCESTYFCRIRIWGKSDHNQIPGLSATEISLVSSGHCLLTFSCYVIVMTKKKKKSLSGHLSSRNRLVSLNLAIIYKSTKISQWRVTPHSHA